MFRLVAAVSGLVLLASACSGSGGELADRTYYESLDLSSPEATIETFVEAFERDDFMTVWLTFDWHAQKEFRGAFDLLQYSKLVDVDKIPEPGTTITNPISDLIGRGNLDNWRIFDELMLVADQHDGFLIDIGRLDTVRPIGDAASGEISVAVVFDGSDDEVIFNLTRGEADRWFVHQVIELGGNTEQVPWGAAAES